MKLLSPGLPRQASKISEALGKFSVEPNGLPRIERQSGKSHAESNNVPRRTSPLRELVLTKEQALWKTKLACRPKPFWYPYATLQNIFVLERLLAGVGLDLLELCRGKYGRVADIGAADGDIAFFLEDLGFSVDVVDNEFTNFNKLDGARILKEALNSSVTIRSIDLDSRSQLFAERYDAVFLLGILYHLKKPFIHPRKAGSCNEILFSEHANRPTNRRRLAAVKVPSCVFIGTGRMQQRHDELLDFLR